jgi:hypothetical protein
LAAFGLYALSACTVRRRYLEIVIRKLHDRAPAAMFSLIAALFATALVATLATAKHTARAMNLLPAEALRR